MKHIPNILSVGRMLLAVSLIFTFRSPAAFIPLYLICGATDVLDGWVARATGSQSALGARLDSAADVLMYLVITVIMIVRFTDVLFAVLPLLALIILMRIVNLMIAFYKYHTFSAIHTLLNKLTGILIFLSFMLFFVLQSMVIVYIVCGFALLSAIEEGAILITSKEPDLNRKSIFVKGEGGSKK